MLVALLKKQILTLKLQKLKTNFNNHIHDNYITTPEFNTLAADVFNARLAQTNLVIKTNFDNTASSLNNKISANKTKNESIENKLKKLKAFDSSYFIAKSHFEGDGTQNYLVFQPINRYYKLIANKLYISSWKSKGLSDETINPYYPSVSLN